MLLIYLIIGFCIAFKVYSVNITYVYDPKDWVDGFYFPYMTFPKGDSINNTNINLNPVQMPPLSKTIGAGLRSSMQLPQYLGTQIHHLLTLPDDWSIEAYLSGTKWPVIVVYAGNYFPSLGSAGKKNLSKDSCII